MLITSKNIDIWYKEYTEQHKKSTKYAKSRGGKTRGLSPLSRAEFELDFKSEAADNPDKSGSQIAKSMAKEEVFTKSYKQAQKLAEAHAREFGEDLTADLIAQYRLETNTDIFPEIEYRRAELKKQGKDNATVKLIIGQEFFGSE